MGSPSTMDPVSAAGWDGIQFTTNVQPQLKMLLLIISILPD